jgi:hypothetical protein
MKKILLLLVILGLTGFVMLGCNSTSNNYSTVDNSTSSSKMAYASDYFDESYWKLQYPAEADSSGIIEQTDLTDFQNWYFYDSFGYIAFRVHCDQGGTTLGSTDRRSELRQTKNAGWTVLGDHSFTCRFKVYNVFLTEQTMLQIHDDPNLMSGSPNKPLLRIIAEGTTLKAKYKTDAAGNNTSACTLKTGLTSGQFNTVKVTVSDGRLYVYVNDVLILNEVDVSFWTWKNYWKAGVYSQDHAPGQDATIYFSSIGVPT